MAKLVGRDAQEDTASARYIVSRMTMADIPRVMEIEKLAYPTSQWPPNAYRRELQENHWAHYIVVRDMQAALPSHTTTESDMATRRGFPFGLFNALRQPAPDILQHAIAGTRDSG